MNNISEVSSAIHLISVEVLSIFISSKAFLLDNALSEFEFVL